MILYICHAFELSFCSSISLLTPDFLIAFFLIKVFYYTYLARWHILYTKKNCTVAIILSLIIDYAFKTKENREMWMKKENCTEMWELLFLSLFFWRELYAIRLKKILKKKFTDVFVSQELKTNWELSAQNWQTFFCFLFSYFFFSSISWFSVGDFFFWDLHEWKKEENFLYSLFSHVKHMEYSI